MAKKKKLTGMPAAGAISVAGLALIAIVASPRFGPILGAEEKASLPDCGTVALAALLRFEGHGGSVAFVKNRLAPAPSSSSGRSMQEISDGAGRCGLKLTGVQLPRDASALKRPMIILFSLNGHGHYKAVRPITGGIGRVQVVDALNEPTVMHAESLLAAPGCTGYALVPIRPNWLFRFSVAAVLISGVLAVSLLRRRRRRTG